jgi:replication factor A1|tara:strand:+ start:4063 stop:5370 length:1308 start_codon:yes stop_codon:yes gene_type:complete
MITIPLADIKEKIKEQTSVSENEIDSKIKKKLEELSGLISEEGAAHIVANELNVKLVSDGEKVKIKGLLTGMRNIEMDGKVTKKYELREFNTNGRIGKVANFMISDDTGFIRAVLWNDQTDKFADINEGLVVKIKGGYIRENNGRKEIHLTTGSELILNPEGVSVKNVQESVKRKKISELQENDENIEVLATIVQAFDIRFFAVDPDSGKRVMEKEGRFYVDDKEIPSPKYAYVMNLFLDDGTENIRTVLWRNQVQRLLGLSDEEVLNFKDKPEEFETVKNDLLGAIVKVIGRINKNKSFDRLELIANLIYKDVDPEEEISKLKEEQTKTVTEQKTETEEIIQKEESIEQSNQDVSSSVDITEQSSQTTDSSEKLTESKNYEPTTEEQTTESKDPEFVSEAKATTEVKENISSEPTMEKTDEEALSIEDLEDIGN